MTQKTNQQNWLKPSLISLALLATVGLKAIAVITLPQAFAQEPEASKPAKRDPTKAPKIIQEFLNQPNKRAVHQTTHKDSLIVLKARILAPNKPALAIIQANQRLILIRVGQVLNLVNHDAAPENYSVISIDAQTVILKAEKSSRQIILN